MKVIAQQIYSVFKVRIGFAIMMTALAGIAVSPGVAPDPWKILVLALAVLGSAGSAGAFNQIYERKYDGLMARTRGRPFVTGVFTPGPAWYAGIGLLLAVSVGAVGYVLNGMAALYVFLGAFFYGIVYTVWLKRRTSMNIVVGGLSGSFAVLAGASAVDPALSPPALLLATALFLWTPPHFWSLAAALRDDYAKAGVPMLPVVVGERTAARVILLNTVLLIIVSILPAMYGLGWLYWAGAAAGGSYFLLRSIQYVRTPTPERAMRAFFASLIQLGLLLLGAFASGLTVL